MSSKPYNFKQRDVTRAKRAAIAAGDPNAQIEIDVARRTITIIPGEPPKNGGRPAATLGQATPGTRSRPMLRTKSGLPKHCSWNVDRHGKRRVRFRKGGFSTYITGTPWSEDFMRQYAAALDGVKTQASNIGAGRTVAGTRRRIDRGLSRSALKVRRLRQAPRKRSAPAAISWKISGKRTGTSRVPHRQQRSADDAIDARTYATDRQ